MDQIRIAHVAYPFHARQIDRCLLQAFGKMCQITRQRQDRFVFMCAIESPKSVDQDRNILSALKSTDIEKVGAIQLEALQDRSTGLARRKTLVDPVGDDMNFILP